MAFLKPHKTKEKAPVIPPVEKKAVGYRIPVFNFSGVSIERKCEYVEKEWGKYLDPIRFDIESKLPRNPVFAPPYEAISPRSGKIKTYYPPDHAWLMREFPKPPKTPLVLIFNKAQWDTTPLKNAAKGWHWNGYIISKFDNDEDEDHLIHELCHFYTGIMYKIPDTTHDSDYNANDLSITMKQIAVAQERVKQGLSARISSLEALAQKLQGILELRK